MDHRYGYRRKYGRSWNRDLGWCGAGWGKFVPLFSQESTFIGNMVVI